MRVHGLSTGVVRGKRRGRGPRRYLPGGWSDHTLPVNLFAVEHAVGVCLFDTGQSARAAAPGYLPRWHPFLRLARFELEPSDEAAAGLRAAGVDPADVRWVVLSHLHTDHVGGLPAFAAAEILVSDAEWRRGTGLRGRLRGYVPQHWPRGARPHLLATDGPAVGPFAWSYDLAGDGALLVVPTPGHTPGHVSLLVRDGPRLLLLAGDAAHDPSGLDRAASTVGAWCREHDVVVLSAHDPRATGLH